METTHDIKELEEIARQLRVQTLKVIHHAGSGHPGGSLSATDMITALYFSRLNHKPDEPTWKSRDRFVLSKGHCCPILYCTLARQGYFADDELWKLRQFSALLQGHPHPKIPGIETAAGSLGQGCNVALGMALAVKIDAKQEGMDKDHTPKVYCMVGDGESQEGSLWEAIMAAKQFHADNFVLIIDNNQVQQTGKVTEIMDIGPLADKLKAFGWEYAEIDGNDMAQVMNALTAADNQTGPFCIISHTLKGKGVSFMELNKEFHGRSPTDEELQKALVELGEVSA